MPHLSASGITMAAHGDSVDLECIVDAHPEPKMMFWRDYSQRVPVIRGPKYDITTLPVKDVSIKTIIHEKICLTLSKCQNDFCLLSFPFSMKMNSS